MAARENPIRRVLLWWFRYPNNPYVSVSGVVDFTPARAYLAALRARGASPRVTINHLVCAAIGRTYARFPQANARVVGWGIRREPHVGVAMPVNLLGHAGGADRETSMMLLTKVETLSLLEVAAASAEVVESERSGEASDPLMKLLVAAGGRLPDAVFFRGLAAFWRAMSAPLVAPLVSRLFPVTVALSNPGAELGRAPGVLFRGGAVSVPGPGWQVGSLFGITGVQDEVFAVDGQPAVRPALPLMFVFDHRLFDGVVAGRILAALAAILQAPAAEFGEDGGRRPG